MNRVKITVECADMGVQSAAGQMILGLFRNAGFRVGLSDPIPGVLPPGTGVGKLAMETIVSVETGPILSKIEELHARQLELEMDAHKAVEYALKVQIKKVAEKVAQAAFDHGCAADAEGFVKNLDGIVDGIVEAAVKAVGGEIK